jgi:hypothetical protein
VPDAKKTEWDFHGGNSGFGESLLSDCNRFSGSSGASVMAYEALFPFLAGKPCLNF